MSEFDAKLNTLSQPNKSDFISTSALYAVSHCTLVLCLVTCNCHLFTSRRGLVN